MFLQWLIACLKCVKQSEVPVKVCTAARHKTHMLRALMSAGFFIRTVPTPLAGDGHTHIAFSGSLNTVRRHDECTGVQAVNLEGVSTSHLIAEVLHT